MDTAGNPYFPDVLNNKIRKVSGGIITTVAGNGVQGFSADGGPATNAQLAYPHDVAVDTLGNLYIADGFRVRKVSGGIISTFAGSGQPYSGDGGPAINAELGVPSGIAADAAGNLYFADSINDRVGKISNGIISTVAGNGTPGYSGRWWLGYQRPT